jgi:hypothetical protein
MIWIEMHIQIFVNEYQEWNIRTPDDIKNLRASLSLLAFPPLPQFFAAGLIIRKQRTSPSSPASPTSQSSPTLTISFAVPSTPPAPLPRPPTQTSIPASQPQNPTLKPCSTIQLAQLVQAIAVLSRLTFLMAKTLKWDSSTTQKEIPFVMVRTPLFPYPLDTFLMMLRAPHPRLYILTQTEKLTRA